MKRRIGLAALTCMELAPPDLVSAAAAAGYDSVGLRLIPVAGQTLPPFDLRETERRLADADVTVLDVEVFRLEPGTRVADFEPVLAQARGLGATELLVHGADPDETRVAETFGRLCELAARYQLSANLEPMPWVETSTVAKAKRIVQQAGGGAVLVDAIHFYRADNRLDELAGMPARYLQLCDARRERPSDMREMVRQARGDRLFPGEGGLDLRSLIQALPAGLPVSVEIPYAKPMPALERATRALAATREFLEKA